MKALVALAIVSLSFSAAAANLTYSCDRTSGTGLGDIKTVNLEITHDNDQIKISVPDGSLSPGWMLVETLDRNTVAVAKDDAGGKIVLDAGLMFADMTRGANATLSDETNGSATFQCVNTNETPGM